MKKPFFVLLLFAAFSWSATPNFYVATTGSDAAAGTLAAPFATLTKARDTLRTFASLENDVTIFIRVGTYTLSAPFTLTSADSGRNGFKITYRAYNNENVIISGGTVVTGWSLHDAAKGIYKATVGTDINSRQLYVNGIRCTRAHYSSGTGWTQTEAGYTAPAWFDTLANDTNIEIHSHLSWMERRARIASISGTTVTMAQPGWDFGRFFLSGMSVLGVENAYEFIDSVSEWYLNRVTGVLYYKPRVGENLATDTVVLANLEKIIDAEKCSNTRLVGLKFKYATWYRPNSEKGFAQNGGDGLVDSTPTCPKAGWFNFTSPSTWSNCAYLIPGNVQFNNSNNIKIDSCRFENLGATGLRISGKAVACTVTNSSMSDISCSGLSFGDIFDTAGITNGYVAYDSIHDCGVEFSGCVGIYSDFCKNTKFTRNTIYNLPYTGIIQGLASDDLADCPLVYWSNHNEISYNYVHDVMKVMRDGGGLYVQAKQLGTVIKNNFVQAVGSDFGLPIYFDNGSVHIKATNNVLDSMAAIYTHNWSNANNSYDTLTNNFTNFAINITPYVGCVVADNTQINGRNLNNWPIAAQKIMDSSGVTIQGLTYTPTIAVDLSPRQNLSSLQSYTFYDSAYSDGTVTHKLYRRMPGVDTTLIQTTEGNAMRYTWEARYKYNGATWVDSIFSGALKTATIICTTVVSLTAADYVELSSNLSSNTTITAGTYYLTSNIATGNYTLTFDLSGGSIYIKSNGFGFNHNGTGLVKTVNGSDTRRLIFTSRNDNAHGAIIDSSTGAPASADRKNYDLLSNGTGSDSLLYWESWYGRMGSMIQAYNGNATAKVFCMKHWKLKYWVHDSAQVMPFVGAQTVALAQFVMRGYIFTDFSIDTTCHLKQSSINGKAIMTGCGFSTGTGNILIENGYSNPKLTAPVNYNIYCYWDGGYNVKPKIKNVLIPAGGLQVTCIGGTTDSITISNCAISGGAIMDAGLLATATGGSTVPMLKLIDNVFYNCTKVGGYGVLCNSAVKFKRVEGNNVYYNNTNNNDSAISATSWTTENPSFAVLKKPLKKLTAPIIFPDGWAIGNAAIKKHGSRTVTSAGVPVATSTFDGIKLAAADTVTAGIWYSAIMQSGGADRGDKRNKSHGKGH